MKRYEVTWPVVAVLAIVLGFILGAHALHAPPAVLALAGALGSAVMAFAKQMVTDLRGSGSTIPPGPPDLEGLTVNVPKNDPPKGLP